LTNVVPAQSLPVLTNAAQIRALSSEQAQRNYPVRLCGVVVYCSHKIAGNFVLQDATADIFVFGSESHLQTVKRGQIVELEGETKMVATATPDIRLLRLKIAGETELPPPRPVSYSQLALGNEDSQWVEVRGIVRSVSKVKFPAPEPLTMELSTGGNRLILRVEKYDLAKLQTLVDAEVRLRGLCFYFFNRKHQIFNFRVSVQEMEDIVVEKPAPENPFGDPVSPVSHLLLSTPGGKPEHRVHIQGEVTSLPAGGAFYLQDETQGLRVHTSEATGPLNLNDRVEVVGFVEMGEYSPVVRDAIFRRLKPGPPIPAPLITAETVSAHDSGLVRIEAKLLERIHLHDDLVLILQTTNSIFSAHLRAADAIDPLGKVRTGSQVEVTGICAVSVGDASDYLQTFEARRSGGFGLWLRSPADVVVLRQSSWWTFTSVLWLLAAVSLICLVAITWVVVLNNRVRAQTGIIRETVRREAVLEERSRISRELHDTLQQALAGLHLQLDAGITFLEVAPEKVRDALVVSRAMVDHSQSEARRSIWDLRSHVLETGGLTGAFEEMIVPSPQGNNPQIEFRVVGEPRRLPMAMETNVLRIGQEAVTNALKHAGARWIRVELVYEPEKCLLRISDDGEGFDPSAPVAHLGHFGLLGMRERAGKIKGWLQIHSRPGGGTVVEVVVPIPSELTDGSHSSKTRPRG
jgi:signal transduction histidine kinase